MKSKNNTEKMVPISFKVPKELCKKINTEASACNMDRSNYLRHLFDNNTAKYYTGSVLLVNQACILSTSINKMKIKHPSIDFSEIEKGVSNICAILNS